MRRYILIAAIILFAGGLLWSIRAVPDSVSLEVPWALAKIAVFGVFARLAISVVELKASAPLAGARLGWADSFRVGIVSSAANILPLPGGPMVRIAALKLAGGTVIRSSAVTFFLGLSWLGLAFGYAGVWLLNNQVEAAIVFMAISGISLSAVLYFLYSAGGRWGVVLILLAVKAAAIAVGLVRLFWAFEALGETLEPAQLAVFAVSGVAGSILAVVPSGIGVNEAAAAILAPLVSIDSATAFIAASLNRLVGLPILMLVIPQPIPSWAGLIRQTLLSVGQVQMN